MTKLIHLTLWKVKISGEVPWKLWLPLVLIYKKVFWGLCFWYSCCVALGPAILGDKNLIRCTFYQYDFGQRFSLALILLLFSLLLLLLFLWQLLIFYGYYDYYLFYDYWYYYISTITIFAIIIVNIVSIIIVIIVAFVIILLRLLSLLLQSFGNVFYFLYSLSNLFWSLSNY